MGEAFNEIFMSECFRAEREYLLISISFEQEDEGLEYGSIYI